MPEKKLVSTRCIFYSLIINLFIICIVLQQPKPAEAFVKFEQSNYWRGIEPSGKTATSTGGHAGLSSVKETPGRKLKAMDPLKIAPKLVQRPSAMVKDNVAISSSPLKGNGTKNQADKKKVGQFPCHLCPKTFTNNSNLLRHVRGSHQAIQYPCSRCPSSFTKKASLLEHEKMHASGIPPVSCDLCGAQFFSKLCLTAHLFVYHQAEKAANKI